MSARTFAARIPGWTWVTIATVVAVIAGLSVWVFGFLMPSQTAAAQTVTRTTTAALQTLQKTVTATGTVTPAVQDDVDFAVSGTVTKVNVAAGDTVKKGQVLAVVDTLQLKASLLDAKATLAEAKATLASAKSANDGSSAAEARVSAASAAVDVAKSAVTDAETAMDDAELTAPAAGLVTSVGISVGDKVSGSGTGSSSSGSGSGSGNGATGGGSGSTGSSTTTTSSAAFTIVSTDSWTLDVSVGETDVTNVSAGEQVELTTDDDTTYYGVVSEVGLLPSTSSGSAEYPVTITVTGDGKGLFDGVSVDAAIVYERRTDVLAVPSGAVTTADGKSTVTVVGSDGSQTVTTVEVGDTAGGYTEITSGIEEGTTVVLATFTPGTGNSSGSTGTNGQFPGGGSGEFPGGGSGEFPGGGSGQFPGGGQNGGTGGTGQGNGQGGNG